MENILHKMNDMLSKLKDKGENDLVLELQSIILDVLELKSEQSMAEMKVNYETLVSKLSYEH